MGTGSTLRCAPQPGGRLHLYRIHPHCHCPLPARIVPSPRRCKNCAWLPGAASPTTSNNAQTISLSAGVGRTHAPHTSEIPTKQSTARPARAKAYQRQRLLATDEHDNLISLAVRDDPSLTRQLQTPTATPPTAFLGGQFTGFALRATSVYLAKTASRVSTLLRQRRHSAASWLTLADAPPTDTRGKACLYPHGQEQI